MMSGFLRKFCALWLLLATSTVGAIAIDSTNLTRNAFVRVCNQLILRAGARDNDVVHLFVDSGFEYLPPTFLDHESAQENRAVAVRTAVAWQKEGLTAWDAFNSVLHATLYFWNNEMSPAQYESALQAAFQSSVPVLACRGSQPGPLAWKTPPYHVPALRDLYSLFEQTGLTIRTGGLEETLRGEREAVVSIYSQAVDLGTLRADGDIIATLEKGLAAALDHHLEKMVWYIPGDENAHSSILVSNYAVVPNLDEYITREIVRAVNDASWDHHLILNFVRTHVTPAMDRLAKAADTEKLENIVANLRRGYLIPTRYPEYRRRVLSKGDGFGLRPLEWYAFFKLLVMLEDADALQHMRWVAWKSGRIATQTPLEKILTGTIIDHRAYELGALGDLLFNQTRTPELLESLRRGRYVRPLQ